jgi:hypothetical protein
VEPAAQVVTQRDGTHQIGAGPPFALAHRERGGHDGTPRMRLGYWLEVVGLICMGAHAVGERRVDGRGA